jgi:hypothetical protein
MNSVPSGRVTRYQNRLPSGSQVTATSPPATSRFAFQLRNRSARE